jgi:hypothetical protein
VIPTSEFHADAVMDVCKKVLRPYQARLLTDVCRASGDVLVEQPTGSGKTMQIVTLVAMQIGRRFTHALIGAPQEQIEHGFVHRDYQQVAWSDHRGVAVPAVEVPEELILASRKSDLGSVRQIRSYLRLPGPVDHALACTHAALNRMSGDMLPDDLSGKALFIDEAHHASADGLSEMVSLWRERGGQLFFFTATPYRGDGRPVALEAMRLFRRSLAEHMAEEFAPGHLDSEIVALGSPGDAVSGGVFHGEEPLPGKDINSAVQAISRKWLDDGKPKAIVRVPPMRGGSAVLVGRLMEALSRNGARVLNATGTGANDKQRFLAALASEKIRTFAESRYDIIVGIQRVMEGTDWPVCSAVYCVGMPGSLNTVVQLLGRAMRPKGDGYPSSHRDRARLVFFVPCGGGSALADLSLDHSRHALLTCCFLADHEVGQEWIVLREVRRGIEDALGSCDENPVAADAENEADVGLDPEVRAEVELVMASAREQIMTEGGEPTLGEVLQLAAKTRPDLPEAALHRVAAEILASQSGSWGTKAREAIHKEVAKRLRIDPMVKKAMEEAFLVVLKEFRATTLKDSAVLERVRRQVHGVTGGQMREFAQRLRNAAPRPLTEEQILAWADAHWQRVHEWPNVYTGEVTDSAEETWRGLDGPLRHGTRGLQGNSSLAQLLALHRGVRNLRHLPPLTIERILTCADAHHRRTGKWPNADCGPVADAPDETWTNIDSTLRIGLRGFPGGSSLAQLLDEERGVRNRLALPQLTKELILAWADAHRERTGLWPQAKSGPVIGVPGESWPAINDTLRRGARGLPGGSSLPQLLAEERGVRNQRDPPVLTREQILAWADAQYQRTGDWPKVSSGPVHDAPDEKWANIHAALYQGARGLSGGSSLAQLLADERGVRNSANLPPLTTDQILAWADAHHEGTAQWPKSTSGPIQDVAGETWEYVDSAIKSGLRGLPVCSSLAQLLADERGVRHHLALPPLSKEQILAWADAHRQRTGKWPKQASGAVHDAPGEKWANIDAALGTGRRGLSGGSSLAHLLAEERAVRNQARLPPLRTDEILAWADAHHHHTGKWPKRTFGPIHESPGETWSRIDGALVEGHRGLPGGSSLSQLLANERGVRNHLDLPPLTEKEILKWADAHKKRTGSWPKQKSGPILDAPGETWTSIDRALLQGRRGLRGRSSLARLIKEHRRND